MRFVKSGVTLFCCLILISCVSSPSTIIPTTSETSVIDSTVETIEEGTIISTLLDLPEEIKNILSLGSYEEMIRLGGEYRNDENIIIESSAIFPEGKVVSMTTSTVSTLPKFSNISKDTMKHIIDLIEEEPFIEESAFIGEPVGLSAEILLLNTKGNYTLIGFAPSVNGQLYFSLFSLDPVTKNYKWTKGFYIESQELVKTLIEISGWREIAVDSIKPAKEIIIRRFDLFDSNAMPVPLTITDMVALGEEDMQEFYEIISQSEKSVNYGQHQFEILIEYIDPDGIMIPMKINQMNMVAIEGRIYTLPEKATPRLQKLLAKLNIVNQDDVLPYPID